MKHAARSGKRFRSVLPIMTMRRRIALIRATSRLPGLTSMRGGLIMLPAPFIPMGRSFWFGIRGHERRLSSGSIMLAPITPIGHSICRVQQPTNWGSGRQGVARLKVQVLRAPTRREARYRRGRRYAPVPGYIGRHSSMAMAFNDARHRLRLGPRKTLVAGLPICAWRKS